MKANNDKRLGLKVQRLVTGYEEGCTTLRYSIFRLQSMNVLTGIRPVILNSGFTGIGNQKSAPTARMSRSGRRNPNFKP